MASTLFFWRRVPAVSAKYLTALLLSGLVSLISAYHYMRIFNSRAGAYAYAKDTDGQSAIPGLTGVPYMSLIGTWTGGWRCRCFDRDRPRDEAHPGGGNGHML